MNTWPHLPIKTPVWIRIFLFLLFCHSGQRSSQAQGQYVGKEVIVKLKMEMSKKDKDIFMEKAQNLYKMSLKNYLPKIQMFHYSIVSEKSVKQMIEDIGNDPNVEYAEPNYIIKKTIVSDLQLMSPEELHIFANEGDQRFPHTDADIHAVEVWDEFSNFSGTPMIVAVIDTGLDTTHDVFVESDAIWTNPNEIPGNKLDDDGNGYVDDTTGWNFVSHSAKMIDDDGHGTHVSGIILGVGQNILESPLSTSSIQIMPLKFLNGEGVGNTADAIKAIYYAIENGARVLNNSWGGSHYSIALHEAIVYSYEQGVTFVAASGNSGTNNDDMPIYPANYDVPHVISVAATTVTDELTNFSNFGIQSVDIGSPGMFIWSTIPQNRYGYASGTSMSAAFVSGLATLMLVNSPQMLGYQVKSIIFQEADEITDLAPKISQGSRINVEHATSSAQTSFADSFQPDYVFTRNERSLASLTNDLGSCGTVSKLYHPWQGGSGLKEQNPRKWARNLLFLGIMILPLLLLQYLRRLIKPRKRQHERLQVETNIKIKMDDNDFLGSVKTISLGGLQVHTDSLLEKGAIITMTVNYLKEKKPIKIRGHVVWRREKNAYGVQFTRADNHLAFEALAA